MFSVYSTYSITTYTVDYKTNYEYLTFVTISGLINTIISKIFQL